jgi:exonuclease III
MALLKPGKMQELAEQIAKTQLEIVALQETRWSGTGQINKKDYILYYIILYYSGSKTKAGHDGTGFLLMKRIQKQ